MRANIPSLTGLRFIAAISVVIAHALPKIIPLPPGSQQPIGYTLLSAVSAEGMSLFFVLSGFVIHYNYSEQIQHEGRRGVLNFFIARFARLYPLYLCCLAFDLLSSYSYSQVSASFASVLPYYLTLTQSWFYLPFGENALVYQFGPMPQVAWSISTEWFFYCVYPFICYGLARLGSTRGNLLAALGVSVLAVGITLALGSHKVLINGYAIAQFGTVADVASHWQDSLLRWILYFAPYSRIFEFLLGCVCASIYTALSDRSPTPNETRWSLVALLGATLAIFVLHLFFFGRSLFVPPDWAEPLRALHSSFGFAVPMSVMIFCCARYDSALSRWLSSRSIVLCGEASYSIYLLHLPVILAFRWEAAPVSSARVLIADALRLGMTVFSVIGLSLVVWALVEVPSRRALRRLIVLRRPHARDATPAGAPLAACARSDGMGDADRAPAVAGISA